MGGLAFAVLVTGLGVASFDDSSISPATVAEIKTATVFIKVESDQLSKSGSGFVVQADDKATYIVTNHHVIASTVSLDAGGVDRRNARTLTLKNPRTTVIFRSGTRQEQSLPAEVLAADETADLAVLKVGAVKGVKPIAFSQAADLVETMPIYTFGFPYGSALSVAKGNPAITVGKGTVSSIRLNDAGEVGMVQLDGSMNPGNSGGPVVDIKGRLIGVAVATIRNSSGIGFAVPAAELQKVIQGKPGVVKLKPGKGSNGKAIAQIEMALVDPFRRIKSVTLHYAPFEAKGGTKLESIDSLEKLPGTRKLELTLEKLLAKGEFVLPGAAVDQEFLVQAVYLRDDGKTVVAKVARTPFATEWEEEAASPPAGGAGAGRETGIVQARVLGGSLADRVFKDEAPKGGRLIGFEVSMSNSRIRPIQGIRPIYRTPKGEVMGEQYGAASGQTESVKAKEGYAVGALTGKVGLRFDGFSVTFMRIRADGLDTHDVYQSDWIGMQRPGVMAKVSSDGAAVVGVAGKTRGNEVSGLGLLVVAPKRSNSAPPENRPPSDGNQPESNETKILGGGSDPVFKDQAPEAGKLIGFKIGLGKFVNNDVIRAIRPIYLTSKGEVMGEQRGTDTSREVEVKAKPGYAVGAITGKAGLTLDGFSVTFMRVEGPGLSLSDVYQSDWLGGRGGGPETKLGGTGVAVIGIVGKSNPKDFTGLGLMLAKPK
jgi:Trypsin-like peptidase domain